MDTGDKTTVTTSWTTLYEPSNPSSAPKPLSVTTIGVEIDAGETAQVYIRVANLHGSSDDGLRLIPGHRENFTLYPRGLGKVEAKTNSGSAEVRWTVIARKTN